MRSVTLPGSSRAAAALVVALLGCTACDDDGGGSSSGFETLIVADRVQGNAPLRVAFRARANGPLDAVYTYAWDFDDGTTSAEEEPLHFFAAAGAYQVGVDVQASTGGRGQASVEVEVFPSADLDVAQVQIVPQRAQAGEAVTVTWGERNTGAPVVGAWEQRVFLSPAQVYDERAVILDVLPHADDPTLDAYAGFERSVSLPAGLASGDWFVGVIADPDENIGDLDRANNTAFAPFPLTVRNTQQNGPDLTFCGLGVPAFADIPAGRRPTLQQGDQIPVTLCLGNLGDQPVGLASYVLLLSRDDQPDPADTVVGRRANLPLGSGDRSDFEDLMDIPVDLEPGAWTLIAVADPDDAVPERDEGNNVRVLTGGFDVAEPGNVDGLDLVLVSITVEQERAFWGQSLTGQLRLANRGNLGVERAFPVRVTAEPVDGGASIQLRSLTVPAFAGGADEVFALDLPIDRRVAAGSYRLVAEADPTNATGDVNRANNRRTYQQVLTLGGQPDFDPAAGDVTVSAEIVDAGDMLTVAGRISNRGGDATGPLEVAVVFSPDGTFEPSDVIIERFPLPSLDGGAEADVERTVVVPFELDQQIDAWRVGLMVDPDNRLSGEADEANNFAVARSPVQVIGATGGCAEDDENEDNDIPQGARRLGGGVFEGLGMCDGADWFSVRVPAGRVFDLAARWDTADGTLTLRQTDPAGATLQAGEGVGGELRLFEPPAAEDVTHYFEITGGGARFQYDLEIGVLDAGEGPNLRTRRVEATPAIAQAGAMIDVAFEIVNAGGGRAEASRARVELLVGEQVVALGEADVPALAEGTSVAGRVRGALPGDLADGRYTIRVVADAGEALAEGDEADNAGFGQLRIDAEQACRADPLEPNSSPLEGAGGVAVVQVGQYDDLVACDGDDDWYAIDLMEGQRLSVEIAFRTLDGDLEMALYGPDGQTILDESASLQNTERVELLRAPAPGRYFIRVFLNPGDAVNVANTYDLAIAVGDAGDCVDDVYQPNGDADRAALLPDGRHDLVLCPGDEDWFRFAIPAGNTVSFQLAAGDAGARLTLQDPDGSVVGEDARRIVHMAETNGMYRLRVAAPGDARVVYVLTVTGVSGVDLAIDSVRLTAQRAAPGDDVRADITVSNRRGDAAEDVLVRYLFSRDQTPSADDTVLAERTLLRVDGAALMEVRQRLRLPPDLQADDGFVVAVLDPLREVADVRPANNIGSAPLAVVAACMDDDARENEGPLTATSLDGEVSPLAGGVICPFTEDWYALPVEGEGDVTIELRFQHARGDLDLEVYDADGLLLAASATEGDQEQVVVPVIGPDVLLLRVDGFLDAQNDYRLSWTLP